MWLPAPSFYVLAVAVTIAVFFVIWRFLQEEREETPWIMAGLVASVVLSGAVILREVILRRARNRIFETQKRLDRSLKGVGLNSVVPDRPNKLTLERNSTILREIRQKSDAARVLGNMASGHKEVVELCERYLSINARELTKVGPGSPRLAPLLKGKDISEDLHRYHMLQWAEVEARSLGDQARVETKAADKVKVAGKALSVLDSVLQHYPDEPKLTASADALNEFIANVKISDWVEKAQKATFRGNYKQAKKHYNDALFFVGRYLSNLHGRDLTLAKINEELEKINHLEA
jgi:hypothetical protein